jgi:hypothetical protein
VNVFVDTSVWSLALRRKEASSHPEVEALSGCLAGGDVVFTTGLVLQELLQGFQGPKQRQLILRTLSALPLIVPDREDHIEAASLRNAWRRRGVQAGTIDALIAQLCIRHGLRLLTTDHDFHAIARLSSLKLFKAT